MPRGVKGSGKAKDAEKPKRAYNRKAKAAEAAEATSAAVVESIPNARKPYPSCDERIALADAQIARLSKLNAERTALIEKTERTLAERKDALAKSTTALEKAQTKRDRLIASKEKPVKKTAEERAAEKAAKKAEQDKALELLAALKDSGKSVEELLAELKG